MSSGNRCSGVGRGREYQGRAIVVKRRMPAAGLDDLILKRFRAAVDEIYGDRIERVVLFGSRARGDAREDSDYDIAVFLNDLTDRWREMHRLAGLGTGILEETGEFVHAMTHRAGFYRERTPLMHADRKDRI